VEFIRDVESKWPETSSSQNECIVEAKPIEKLSKLLGLSARLEELLGRNDVHVIGLKQVLFQALWKFGSDLDSVLNDRSWEVINSSSN